MEADKKSEDGNQTAPPAGSEASPPPADSLANPNAAPGQNTSPIAPDADKAKGDGSQKPAKRVGGLKRLTKIFNVYTLLFAVVVAIGGSVAVISYLSSKKTPPAPNIASQTLSTEQLKQLANSNATVGGSSQTVTIQGNAVFSGQLLVRSDLQVAGNIQLGGSLDVAQLNVSTSSNLAKTQTNTLQVTGTSIFQGVVTIQNGMNVTGNTSINTATIGTLTASKIIVSGNAQLQIPNHIGFSGSSAPHVSGLSGDNVSINGSDTSGTVTINTGGSPGAGCMASLTFAQAFFNSKPNVIISLVSSTPINVEYYAGNLSTSGFSICSANAPPANTQFAFSYFTTASSAQ